MHSSTSEPSSSNFRPFRWIRIAIGVILSLILAGVVASIVYAFLHPMPFGGYPRFFFAPFSFFGVLLLFLILFGIFRWVFFPWRWGWGRGGGYYRGHRYYDPAMQALRERYARGEITKEQFEQMAKDLEQH